jgi:cytidylate kinase
MTSVPKRGFVVAIDGPAGAGKSTLARALARTFHLPYVNTGSMYRAVAREALQRGLDPSDGDILASAAGELRFSLDDREPSSLLIDAQPPGPELLTGEVEAIVSSVSRHAEVRDVLRAAQRTLGAGGAVMEGRDIGTVVFPDADVKVFLLAEGEERAARRQLERGTLDPDLAEALERRDELDSRTTPLVAAPDAHVVDTTGRRPAEVLEEARRLVIEAGARSHDPG